METKMHLILEHLTKIFSSRSSAEVTAVDDLNLAINKGEFVTLLGPSGCGKTTTLRLIAGFEFPTEGHILLEGEMINDTPPNKRDMAMVFQSYALFPHLTVYENIAYGLRVKKLSKKVIRDKIEMILHLMNLIGLENRAPRQLSGGQQQRVALARALVMQPKILLLDEPLSNLDAKLRVEMRAEISKLQQRLGVTTIYVTHDQIEAMTLGHRIVVMKDGEIQQVDSPLNLYNLPANKFVAGFIGSPAMNFILSDVSLSGDKVVLSHKNFRLEVEGPFAEKLKPYNGKQIWLGVRPEDLKIRTAETPGEHTVIHGIVDVVEPLGAETEVHVRLEDVKLTARIEGYLPLKPEDEVELEVDLGKLHAFDKDTEKSIGHALEFVE